MPKGSKQVDTGNFDLFGESITRNAVLRDKFIEPPFSILDTTGAGWIKRRKMWYALGIESEVGRGKNLTFTGNIADDMDPYRHAHQVSSAKDELIKQELSKRATAECLPTSIGEKYGRKEGQHGTSIFDPSLCEVLYHWFCPVGGTIIDPFAGGSVRGIVANKLGFHYTGIDIRPEQIEANRQQGLDILGKELSPIWHCGDSNVVLDTLNEQYDFGFSCPPYADLEVYSEIPGDISNMPYKEFLQFYESIIYKSAQKIKKGCYYGWVIGEVRDKKGHYYGLVKDTIIAFEKSGFKFYNDLILKNAIGTATVRANRSMVNQKVVKVHQNVLVFVKV